MKSVFGRYLALFLIGIIIEAVLLIIVLVHTYKYSNGLAQSLFNFIGNWPVSLNVFNFLADWAAALSIFAFCLVIVPFLLNFRKYRRYRALNKLHDWAKNAVLVISDYRRRDVALQDSLLERYEAIMVLINVLKVHHHAALSSARIIGGELGDKAREMVHTLINIEEKVARHDSSAFEDLKSLHHNLANVMISAFESAHSNKHETIWSEEVNNKS